MTLFADRPGDDGLTRRERLQLRAALRGVGEAELDDTDVEGTDADDAVAPGSPKALVPAGEPLKAVSDDLLHRVLDALDAVRAELGRQARLESSLGTIERRVDDLERRGGETPAHDVVGALRRAPREPYGVEAAVIDAVVAVLRPLELVEAARGDSAEGVTTAFDDLVAAGRRVDAARRVFDDLASARASARSLDHFTASVADYVTELAALHHALARMSTVVARIRGSGAPAAGAAPNGTVRAPSRPSGAA